MGRRWWLAVGLGGLILGGMGTASEALVITPGRTEVHLLPGTSVQVTLTATNDDKEEIQVDVSKKDWFVPEINKAWTVDRWMAIQGPARFYLKPGEKQSVPVTLRCPQELVGEVVGMASFRYETENPSMVTPMISVSMYLMASGTEKLSGEVTDILMRSWKGQVHLSAKVRSTGNVHLRPSGRLVLFDAKGNEMGETPVAEGQPTYPGRDNVYFGSLPASVKLAPGMYTVRAELAYDHLDLKGAQTFRVLPEGQIQKEK